MSQYLVNFCPTGAVNSKHDNPSLPVTADEIVADCQMALEKGCQMLHLHGRCQRGEQSGDPVIYQELITRIRALPLGRQAIICVTTTGRYQNDPESRARVLGIQGDARPDMASLTLSSLNFMNSASVNPPKTIEFLAAQMNEAGIRPELEVFDLGMLNYVQVLIRKKLIEPPFYINLLLGNIFTAQANVHHLSAFLAGLPADSVVCVGGLGRFQITANILGLLFTDGVRVGLEDNLKLDGGLATNGQLLDRVIQQADLLGKQLLGMSEARQKVLGE
jgi:3-keto-5-aminohexanoate cleavage enzyme